MSKGAYDLAIKEFDAAIAARPEDADAWNSRGNAYSGLHSLDRAIQNYDTAIMLNPNSALAFKNRGTAYSARDDYDRAIQDLNEAIKIKPDFAGAYNSRGFAFQLKGEYERAVQDYDKSIALAPESAPAYRNRANAHFVLGHFAEAAADLQRSLKFSEAQAAKTSSPYFNETGAYTVVWLRVARMRMGQPDSAEYAATHTRVNPAVWPGPVLTFFDGKLGADQLVAMSDRAEERLRSDQRCGANFFAGQAALWKQQPAEARARFEAARASCAKRYIEHAVATAELARLGSGTK